ncbi:MAG: M48 family metallopeptidase [Caldisericia bacterium]|nr:M48 family metallopeptidase [Caldisericia bacterium]
MDFSSIKIIKSKRKSFCIEILDTKEIVLRVPLKTKGEEIINFLFKHKNWIERKLKIIKEREDNYKEKKFIDKEKFLFLGNFYELKLVEKQRSSLLFDNGFYLKISKKLKAKELFMKFYKQRAKEIIYERVKFYADKYGFKYNKIKITSANKRWGSCGAKGNLNFSYRIIMAPLEIVDYIVVHELVHTKYRNHKKIFYEEVSKILPDYKNMENWLKENGYRLKI